MLSWEITEPWLVSDMANVWRRTLEKVAIPGHHQCHWGASWFPRPLGIVMSSVSGKQALGLLTRRLHGIVLS